MGARVRHRSRAADLTPGEAGGDVSTDAPLMPDDGGPADDPVVSDDVDVSIILQ